MRLLFVAWILHYVVQEMFFFHYMTVGKNCTRNWNIKWVWLMPTGQNVNFLSSSQYFHTQSIKNELLSHQLWRDLCWVCSWHHSEYNLCALCRWWAQWHLECPKVDKYSHPTLWGSGNDLRWSLLNVLPWEKNKKQMTWLISVHIWDCTFIRQKYRLSEFLMSSSNSVDGSLKKSSFNYSFTKKNNLIRHCQLIRANQTF